MIFDAVPARDSETELFALAVHILQKVHAALCIISNRYEKVGTEIHSVAVDVPYACLREYVTTRHIQTHLDANAWRALRREDNPENDFEEQYQSAENRLRQLWKNNGAYELYRDFMVTMMDIRGQRGYQEPPFALVHSMKDDKNAIVFFRDFELFSQFQGLLTDVEFLEWSILDHSPELSTPKLFCENPLCSVSSGISEDEQIMKSFASHCDPESREIDALVKQRMVKLWKEKYEPMVIRKTAEECAHQRIDKADIITIRQIQARVASSFEKEARKEEEAVKKQIQQERTKPLAKCSRCKLVSYCSSQCQKVDYGRHKMICQ